MGEKSVEFRTSLSVKECGQGFQSGIVTGRGLSSKLGGITAMLMGGESLTWYTPEDRSPFAVLNDDRAHFSVGVGVPKAQGAHMHGTNVHMYVWDRGSHRDVLLLARHSLAGGAHANQLLEAVSSHLRSQPKTGAPAARSSSGIAGSTWARPSMASAARTSSSTGPTNVPSREPAERRTAGSRKCVTGSCEARGLPTALGRCPECGRLTQPL